MAAILAVLALICLNAPPLNVAANVVDLSDPLCDGAVARPDLAITLVLPNRIPDEQFTDVKSRVVQRLGLLSLDACSVRLVGNTIFVEVRLKESNVFTRSELQIMLSRQGLIEIIDPVVASTSFSADGGTPIGGQDFFATPDQTNLSVLATNDDILTAIVVAVKDNVWGVKIIVSDQAANRISRFSEMHVGDEWEIIADGIVIHVSTIGEPLGSAAQILISGLSYSDATSLAFYLASDAYPTALCAREPAGSTPHPSIQGVSCP